MDCVVKNTDYIDRCLELGCKNYFTTQHGWTGKFLEAYDLCKKNNLKMIYGAELYMVKDRKEKDNSNYHIVIIAKNQDGFYELNEIMSESNKTGFYYKPRIDIELIKRLYPNNFFITSACVGGILRPSDDMKILFETVYGHFGGNFFLEVQNHPFDIQINHNKKMLTLKQRYNIQLIHANDSHYIFPEQANDRVKFLKGKGIVYGDEDCFILDFPDYDTITERYKKQGLLSDVQVKEALDNTLIFDECEELYFDKEIKMPTIYPGFTQEQKDKELSKHLVHKWNEEKKHVDKSRWKEYQDGIAFEYKIVKDTQMADYFLFNEKMVELAKEKYGGVLSRTGRGSAVSFYINKLLGFTEIDRFIAPVPLYPTRFMSTARILETRSLPDIDQNWSEVSAPIAASKELLGEDGIYYMYALGTMKESSAFRNLCRAYDIPMDEYNEVGKNLDAFRTDKKWKPIIDEAQKYIGTIESISPSPCSFVLSNKPLSKELGLIRVGNELCACIDGYTSDVSVGAGNVLYDLLKCKKIPIITLDKVFRYGKGGLSTVATDTRTSTEYLDKSKSGMQIFGEDQSYIFMPLLQEKIVNYTVQLYKALLSKGYCVEDIAVLSCYNVGDYGTVSLNKKIQNAINGSQEAKIAFGDTEFRLNDIVMNYVNDYKAILYNEEFIDEKNTTFIANGDSGKVVKILKDAMVVDYDGTLVYVRKSSMKNIRLAYAMSTHKSQGGQFKVVILVTPKAHTFMLNSNLLYVGESRAKEKCYHLGEIKTVNNALKKKENFDRKTMLGTFLQVS